MDVKYFNQWLVVIHNHTYYISSIESSIIPSKDVFFLSMFCFWKILENVFGYIGTNVQEQYLLDI